MRIVHASSAVLRVYERASERWEIELREPQLEILTRKFAHGVLVDEATTAHTTSLRAKWEADRICSRLAAQGFVRAHGDAAAIGKADLEDALRASPDDLDTYLVYADWLSERGDDWGQLIAIQHALLTLPRFGESARRDELSRSETALRFRLGARLWGALGETVYDEQTQRYLCDLVDATWHCGFVRTARIRNVGADVFADLVRGLNELAIGLVLRELTLLDAEWADGTIEAFAGRPWPSLERLSITGDAFDARRLVAVLRNAPRLASLDVWGTTNTDALCDAIARAPQLESVRLRQGQLTRAGVETLATAKLPALKTLELGALAIDMRARLQHLAPTVRVHVDG